MPKRSSKHLSFLYLTAQQKVVHLHALFAFQLDFLQAQYAICLLYTSLDVAQRIHASIYMDNVAVLKTANDVHDRIHFADIARCV